MSTFTKPLTVTKINTRYWRVERAFDYHVGVEGSGEVISVPRGFLTDFASVPRVFWVIIPPDGSYSQGAVLHDYMYTKHLYKRKECDRIFYEAMGVLKVPQWKRWLMWKCVRLGGWYGWNKN